MSGTPEPTKPQDKPPLWRGTTDLPQREDLLVIFQGLLSFTYQSVDHYCCEVGVYNQSPDHLLRIKRQGGSGTGADSYVYTSDQLAGLLYEVFNLGIIGMATPNVSFYQVGETFNRETATNEQDFRWLLDVESPDLYNQVVPHKRSLYYGPRLQVQHGTFYTARVTERSYQFVQRTDHTKQKLIGRVASHQGLKIKLDGDQQAVLIFKDPLGISQAWTFSKRQPGKIVFTNLCLHPNGESCGENDFFHHFTSFSPPQGQSIYDLEVLPKKSAAAGEGIYDPEQPQGRAAGVTEVDLDPFLQVKGIPTGTDDAPCHYMGYGQTPSLP